MMSQEILPNRERNQVRSRKEKVKGKRRNIRVKRSRPTSESLLTFSLFKEHYA
jgi:hypothetical protein